jgi:hypothetical protein
MGITLTADIAMTKVLDFLPPMTLGLSAITANKGGGVITAPSPVADIRLPDDRYGWVHVNGGGDVVVEGGTATNHLLVQGFSGDLAIRNTTIDMASQGEHDAYGATPAAKGNILLQRVRGWNIHGSQAGTHGDIFQCYADMGWLIADDVQGSSTYQGIFLKNGPSSDPARSRAIEGARMRNVTLVDLAGKGKLLWLGDHGFIGKGPRVFLDGVAIKPYGNRLLRDCVWPKPGLVGPGGEEIGALSDDNWKSCFWPEASGIVGRVTLAI